jgi:3-isopropylmalate dehydratase small subunit
MEDLDKPFVSRVKEGEIMVAGANFGCGSSREHAPIAIKASGISCVIAKSFARIFYRNAINTGLAIIEFDGDISEGDTLEVDFDNGVLKNLTKKTEGKFAAFPPFLQNIINKALARAESPSGSNFFPSYVLVFDRRGMLQYTLGQSGATANPFYHIESLDVDSNGRLLVISRTFDAWSIYGFTGKNRSYHANLGMLDFTEKDGNDVYNGKIENVCFYSTGDRLLISVDYYHNLRLKYRKVFVYSIKDNRIEKTLLNIPDPKNVLFGIVDDKLIYFWNIDRDVRFSIYNHEGNVVSNIKLNIKVGGNYYTRIIGDRRGNIYSYHMSKEGIQILEWK